MSDALRDAIHDAVWGEVCDYVSAARVNRLVDAVLAIAEADKAEAVRMASGVGYAAALTSAAGLLEAAMDPDSGGQTPPGFIGMAALLRRLAAEAGITVDTHNEES